MTDNDYDSYQNKKLNINQPTTNNNNGKVNITKIEKEELCVNWLTINIMFEALEKFNNNEKNVNFNHQLSTLLNNDDNESKKLQNNTENEFNISELSCDIDYFTAHVINVLMESYQFLEYIESRNWSRNQLFHVIYNFSKEWFHDRMNNNNNDDDDDSLDGFALNVSL
jgi:hypothetical protein